MHRRGVPFVHETATCAMAGYDGSSTPCRSLRSSYKTKVLGVSGLVGISDATALGFVLRPVVHRQLLILRREDEVLKASLKRTPPSPPEQEEERISISNPKHKGRTSTKTDVRHQS